ncbi:MAG: class II aldolase/adducin family protein [Candidatus Aminicenantes bacterium]|nr:class II aldolase/adducin family protein [Candidatus Aminicenantes bacterium]
MSPRNWTATADILRLFQSIGRASLLYDIQDSHSGNMAVKIKDEAGADQIVITAAGSQKGDLDPDQICFLSATETDYGYYKASSETDIHQRILNLPGAGASMHAHTKDLAIATLDDLPKPAQPPDFIPIDPLARHALGGRVPVDWFAVPSGSSEMAERIPQRLAGHAATTIQGHGTFARGRTLKEAFYLLCIANNAGQVVNDARRLKVDVEDLRAKIQADPRPYFAHVPDPYVVENDEACDFPEETEVLKEFRKAGVRIFESRLSPFHTGSMSVRGAGDLLYAPKAATPRDLPGPLRRRPLRPDAADSPELALHKTIYAETDFQTVMHCWLPEAEAHSYFRYPGEDRCADRIVPVDAEGGFMYLVIPGLPAHVDAETLIDNLHDYKAAVVRGGGVWAVGYQSLSEVLHHPSSVREICLYRIGAFERGLDLRKMEPKKAKKW